MRDDRIHPNQAGFKLGRGCVDQIFTLRMLDAGTSLQIPALTITCFINFATALDSIDRALRKSWNM